MTQPASKRLVTEATGAVKFAPKSAAWAASTAVKAGQLLTNGGVLYSVNADMTTPSTFSTTGLTAVASGGGGGAVSSVAGRTGAVTLTADDTPDGSTNKAYTAAEKAKLAGVASSATANDTDANLKNRGNHTGTQSADTLTDGTTNKAFLAAERTKLAGIAAGATANTVGTTSGTVAAGDDSRIVGAATAGLPAYAPAGLTGRNEPSLNLYNLKPGSYINWRAAVAGVRAGTANAKLAHVGDSTTFGTVGGGATDPTVATPAALSRLLNTQACPAVEAIVPGSGADPRVSLGAGWSTSVYSGAGWSADNTATGKLTVTPVAAFDTIVVHFSQNPGLGTIPIDVDGGASLGNVVTGGSPQAIGTATFTCAAGTHVIHASPPTAYVQINEIVTYLSTKKTIISHNLGIGASSSATWTTAPAAAWSLANWVTHLAPDLTTIELTINDDLAATPLATYTANIQTLITQARASGDVLLVAGQPNVEAENKPYARSLVNALYTLADANNCALLDLRARYSETVWVAQFGGGTNGVHYNPAGYADKAAAYFNALRLIT